VEKGKGEEEGIFSDFWKGWLGHLIDVFFGEGEVVSVVLSC
jgi:hypothetical protein